MITSGAERVRARSPLPSDALVFHHSEMWTNQIFGGTKKKRDREQTENSTKSKLGEELLV